MALVVLVLVLFVMLLMVGVLDLGCGHVRLLSCHMLMLHWCRLDNQLRLLDLLGRGFRGDQCKSLLLLVLLWWLDEHRGGRLLCQSLLLTELHGLLDQFVKHLPLLYWVQLFLLLIQICAGLWLIAERRVQ